MTDRGFSLLYTLIILAAILTATSSIFGIVFKQLQLTSQQKEAQKAYYMAESGAECALFHVQQGHVFNDESASLQCGPSTVAMTSASSFTMEEQGGGVACADVQVQQIDPTFVIIESRGYNDCRSNAVRQVERGLRIVY